MALTCTQIWWTTEVGLAFARLEEGYENAIKDYNKKQVWRLWAPNRQAVARSPCLDYSVYCYQHDNLKQLGEERVCYRQQLMLQRMNHRLAHRLIWCGNFLC